MLSQKINNKRVIHLMLSIKDLTNFSQKKTAFIETTL
jgi:hypothetical protein